MTEPPLISMQIHHVPAAIAFETQAVFHFSAGVKLPHRIFCIEITGENLRQAMAENPYLNVMIQSGYYDGATTYFDAKYSMWQLDPSGRMKDRLRFEGYRSGHMMYLRAEDLASSNEHIRDFIRKSTPTGPAKY